MRYAGIRYGISKVYVPLSFFSETLYGLPGFILFYALAVAIALARITSVVMPHSVPAIDRNEAALM